MSENVVPPEKKLTAVCGLYCPACLIYIASHETEEKRAELAQLLDKPPEALHCDGCRAEERYTYCRTCKMSACAQEKGLDFCGECDEYPCADLRAFQAARPHRLELWAAQARIGEAGWRQWLAEMAERYACPKCGTTNSAYNLACRECGATPSCAYVAEHRAEIEAYYAQGMRRQ